MCNEAYNHLSTQTVHVIISCINEIIYFGLFNSPDKAAPPMTASDGHRS